MSSRSSAQSGSSVWLFLFGLPLLGVACSSAEKEVADDQTSFLSYIPGARDGGGTVAGGEPPADGAGGTSNGSDGDPQRAIAEADILRLEGNLLYALSRYSGLSVVDVSNRGALRLVGSYRTEAMPFEMYLEGDRAYVMYNSWGTFRYDPESGYEYVVTSRVQALDISDPAAITLIGDEEVPGEISDSRKVGDVLYLVTYENAYCWGCDTVANTRVSSFDVSNPAEFARIDQLRFDNEDDGWGRNSISVTEERIYVSGWTWPDSGFSVGTIDVVDISDPAGTLKKGAQVSVAGPIESRWQMDEHEGVLRVISQPGGWQTDLPPVVETFEVTSSDTITKLGSLDVVLPRPEALRSVRFDGDRAYAITFERTDPLFTFDLSDPTTPQQLGELEIPGWVYHMEPRGDRIYALGFDPDAAGGSLHVSLFDVSDMTTPQQLARVNFGGSWGHFSEDQDRIHKAFNILPEAGLILVPFGGYEYSEGECNLYGSYQSGIQLVDMTDSSLALRGIAPQQGVARRALLVENDLLGISEDAVQTFDIADRDAPKELGRLELARNVSNIRVMGDTMLRFGTDWWTRETTLDFAALSKVSEAEPLGQLDLTQIDLQEGGNCYEHAYWENQVLVHGDYAYVPRRWYQYAETSKEYREQIRFYIIDIRERTNPTLVGSFVLETDGDENGTFTRVVKTDNAIVVGRTRGHYQVDPWNDYRAEVSLFYDVISLENPEEPRVASTIELPRRLSAGGFGYAVTGCAVDMGWGWWGGGYWYGYYGYGGDQAALVSGDLVVSQHEEAVNDGTGRVRYYLDRLDVSDPEKPVLLPPVNIPGGLVNFDVKSGQIVTIDFLREERRGSSWDDCSDGISYLDGSVCRTYRRRLNTLRLDGSVARRVDEAILDEEADWATAVAATSSRVFYAKHDVAARQVTVEGFELGTDGRLMALPKTHTDAPNIWSTLLARGDRAFLVSTGAFTVVDTSESAAPVTHTFPMGGYYCDSLEVSADTAYCALGAYGVQAFPLP